MIGVGSDSLGLAVDPLCGSVALGNILFQAPAPTSHSDTVFLNVPPPAGPAINTAPTIVKQSRHSACPSDPFAPTKFVARTAPPDTPIMPSLSTVLLDIRDLRSPLTGTHHGASGSPPLPGAPPLTARALRSLHRGALRAARENTVLFPAIYA